MSEQETDQKFLQLANEASKFILSPLGKHLQEQARETVIDVSNELLNVDPEDCKKIRDLQNSIHRYNDSLTWVEELIQAGNNILGSVNE